jgi:hypothetical protein
MLPITSLSSIQCALVARCKDPREVPAGSYVNDFESYTTRNSWDFEYTINGRLYKLMFFVLLYRLLGIDVELLQQHKSSNKPCGQTVDVATV